MYSYYLRNGDFFRTFATIFFYASDPGAWAVMRPFAQFLGVRGHACRYILEGWAAAYVPTTLNTSDLVSWENLQRSTPEGSSLLIYGAQQNFSRNYEILSGASIRGMESLFVFDSWKNYLINFRDPKNGCVYLPSRIAVVDEEMKEGLLNALSGYVQGELRRRIDILGHPAMDDSVAYIRSLPPKRVCELKAKFNGNRKRLRLFIMEPIREDFLRVNGIDPGYDEYSILDYFLTHCREVDSKVLIKVHPRQSIKEVQDFLRSERLGGENPFVQVVTGEKIEDLIGIADEVYGMTSIALNVAIRCGKRVRSIQVGRNECGKSLSNSQLEACLVG